MAERDRSSGSMLLVEEAFDSEDPRFLDYLRDVQNIKSLAAFVERWKRDRRPWSREQMLAYVRGSFHIVGHQVVVKRLFKHAEANRDDGLMAAFMAAFDRLVRRRIGQRSHYDRRSRQFWHEQILVAPRDTLPVEPEISIRHPRTGETQKFPALLPRDGRLYSYKTRYYLRRRVWRYFRRLGFQQPQRYPEVVALALRQYVDEDVENGPAVLECWSLLEACFRQHPVLHFGSHRITVRSGRSLSELMPAPYFAELWEQPAALAVLLSLITSAESQLVRVWAIELVRLKHLQQLDAIQMGQLMPLLDHVDQQVQQFGVELLELSPGVATLSIEQWLRLLNLRNPAALATVCELIKKHVARERLSLRQCIELTCAQAVPVARLGFEYLQQFSIDSDEDRRAIAGLAQAKCGAIGRQLAEWALAIVGAEPVYDRDAVLSFFDSNVFEIRDGAWQWLVNGSVAARDATLFSRLTESPFDDLRMRLIDELQRKSRIPALNVDDLTPIWSTVLLAVHRGGRQKIKASHRIAQAIVERPGRAADLLPVLRVAVRSLRAPEWRAGLASIALLAEHQPQLVPQISQLLPEVKL